MAHGKRLRKIAFWGFILFLFLLLLVAYLHYLDLKKIFIEKVSDKVTSEIQQGVHIKDFSISPSGAVNLYDITIENPDGFAKGELLRIRRLQLGFRLRELINGNFSLRNIILHAPELTLMSDEKGRWNISDGLKRLFSGESSNKYQVDEFQIVSGVFDVDKDEKYHIDSINLYLKNLSSDPNIKTEIMGSIVYARNKIQIDGWAYLNDATKKVNISISSKDFALSSFKKIFNPYKIDIEKTRMGIGLHIDGDTDKGFHMTSNLQIKRMGVSLLKKRLGDIRLRTDVVFIPRDDSLIVNAVSLDANGFSAATLKGVIKSLKKHLSYQGEIKIDRLDLSGLNIIKDIKVKGILSSNHMKIKGKFESKMPELSGSFRLREGGLESDQALIEKIDADIILSSNQEMSIKGEGLGRVVKAGQYSLSNPVDVEFSTTVRGTLQKMDILSLLRLSTLKMKFKGERTLSLSSGNVMIEGTIKDHGFSSKNLLEIKGVRFDDHSIPWLKTSSHIEYQKGEATIKNFMMETKDLKTSANRVKITMPEMKTDYYVEIKGMDSGYQGTKALLKDGDFYLTLSPNVKGVSGTLHFSAKNILTQGFTFSQISGTGRFDNKNFSIDITHAEVVGGRIKVATHGRTSGNIFPIRTTFLAENINLSAIFNEISKSIKLPFHVTGEMKRINFEGTIFNQGSLNGQTSFEVGKLSVSNPSTGRNIIKDAFLHADIEFMEKDLTYKAEVTTGNLSTRLSGLVKDFIGKERYLQLKGTLAEVRISDIRNTFWDIFPDSLLYVGLQGSISSDVSIDYGKAGLDIKGNLFLKDFILEGENGEYSFGPINGTIPIRYGKNQNEKGGMRLPSFEKSQFDRLNHDYARETDKGDFHRLTIGSLRYGFPLLEDVNLFFKQTGSTWNIERFSANISGGKLYGSAIIDLSNGFHYRGGLLVKGVSLRRLCDGIAPIRGFISGKVDGILSFKASGIGIPQMIGMADFWTYSTADEKTTISKEFLQKVGGPSLKAYLRDRDFDKGILSLYMKDGYLIFRDLEISNRNFLGIKNLSVRVAPVSNRISLEHLLWTIAEAGERAKEKK
jgi:hypothetical protein